MFLRHQPWNVSSAPRLVSLSGAVVLGLAIAYGIMRNRSRTRAEKQITEQATKNNYAEEDVIG